MILDDLLLFSDFDIRTVQRKCHPSKNRDISKKTGKEIGQRERGPISF
jgi:hypothetical protein